HIPIATAAKENRQAVLPFAATRWPLSRDRALAIALPEAGRMPARRTRHQTAIQPASAARNSRCATPPGGLCEPGPARFPRCPLYLPAGREVAAGAARPK